MSAPFTAIMVGFGNRGKTLLEVARTHVRDMKIVAVADPGPQQQAEAVAAGLQVFNTFEEMLENVRADVAIIATTPQYHREQVFLAARRGLHLFIEKPLAIFPAEADEMLAAVKKAGVRATVDFETPFADSFEVFRKGIEDKSKFGKLLYFHLWDKGRAPAYDIETCLSHYLHLLMVLLGCRPTEMYSRIRVDGRWATYDDVRPITELWPLGRAHEDGLRADTMAVDYYYPCGVTAHYSGAALNVDHVIAAGKGAAPGGEFMRITAYGTKQNWDFHQTGTGTVFMTDSPQTMLETKRELVFTPHPRDPKWIVPTARLMQDLVDAIRENREPLANIEDAAHIVDQTAGIYVSHLRGGPVELPLNFRENPLIFKPAPRS